MIQDVAAVDFPIDETFKIRKNHISPKQNLSGKRICIVTGTHGDELEGQYVCYEINKRIREHPEFLAGAVDIYPALNPLGIDSITRGIPGFDIDMNRIFPGNRDSMMAEHVAACIIEDLKGADLCVDIHASNIFLKEIPQIRINVDMKEMLVPMAMCMNVDYIWVHAAATVLQSTLAHSLNSIGTPTLVVEMGVGMRITKEYCKQLTEGIFYTMHKMGIWTGPVEEPRRPIISTDGEVSFLNAGHSGVFVPTVDHNMEITAGTEIGQIINPLTGDVTEKVLADQSGLVFTLREYPIVEEGSLLARILTLPEESVKN